MVRVKGRRKAPPLQKITSHSRSPLKKSGGGGSHLSQNHDNTEELILRASKTLFAQKGYEGTTVKDIVDRAGVNISLVSYHFGGKEGLYRFCLEDFAQKAYEDSKKILISPRNLAEFEVRLDMFIDLMLDIFVKEPELSLIAFKECDMESQVAQDIFQGSFLEIFRCIMSFFQEAQKSKLIGHEFDHHTLASIFFGALSHYARMDKVASKYFGRSLKDDKAKQKISGHLKKVFGSSSGLTRPSL